MKKLILTGTLLLAVLLPTLAAAETTDQLGGQLDRAGVKVSLLLIAADPQSREAILLQVANTTSDDQGRYSFSVQRSQSVALVGKSGRRFIGLGVRVEPGYTCSPQGSRGQGLGSPCKYGWAFSATAPALRGSISFHLTALPVSGGNVGRQPAAPPQRGSQGSQPGVAPTVPAPAANPTTVPGSAGSTSTLLSPLPPASVTSTAVPVTPAALDTALPPAPPHTAQPTLTGTAKPTTTSTANPIPTTTPLPTVTELPAVLRAPTIAGGIVPLPVEIPLVLAVTPTAVPVVVTAKSSGGGIWGCIMWLLLVFVIIVVLGGLIIWWLRRRKKAQAEQDVNIGAEAQFGNPEAPTVANQTQQRVEK